MLPKEIYRGYDEFGTVIVLDDGNCRYLSFGETDEQSCIIKQSPSVPQYAFIRAMLFPLLYLVPKRALSFGLGAGSLNGAFHSILPNVKQEIVEISPEVVNVAHKYFYFPRSKRINIDVSDALDYLQRPVKRKFDLITADLYTSEGLNEIQVEAVFIDAAVARLSQKGWLVLNCWSDHREVEILDTLRERFESVFSCTTGDGNWVLFATNGPVDLSSTQMKSRIKELSSRAGFAVNTIAKRVRQVV
jgi:spermidine synthase